MKLTLTGHDDRYAVEQLQMALFPEGTEGEAFSTLIESLSLDGAGKGYGQGAVWLTLGIYLERVFRHF